MAGWLLPWGYRITQKLPSIALVSCVAGLGLYAIGIIAGRGASSTAVSDVSHGSASIFVSALLAITWLIYGAAWMYLLGQYCRTNNNSQQATTSFFKALLVVGGALVASIGSYIAGQTKWALSITGGPLLVLGAFYGTILAVTMLSGKNARWN